MPAIDHLVYAVPDLDTGVAEMAQLTGAEAVAGGSHPGRGTRNALLSFDDATYFEIISVDPEQSEPDQPRPFGVDPTSPARLFTFAIHPIGDETIADIAERMQALGLPVGPVTSMRRKRPDGVEIQWRLSRNERPTVGVVPFVIDWGTTETPAKTTPPMGRLLELRLQHGDPDLLKALFELDIGLDGGRVVVANGEPGLSAIVETVSGQRVELI